MAFLAFKVASSAFVAMKPVWQSLCSGPEQKCPKLLRPHTRLPRSTQTPGAPAASRLHYERRRNANALPERGHIELIEPILAIISVEKLLIFQPKLVICMSKNLFCLIKTCA